MITYILNKLGYILKSESDEKLRGVREMYEEELSDIKIKNSLLRAEVRSFTEKVKEEKQIFDFSEGDPIPSGVEERKMYVASVAAFYKSILEQKLKYCISVAHNLLEETSSDRDFDLTVKGVVYSFRELMKWGETMLNEQVANQLGDEPEEVPLTDRIKELTKE